MQLNNNLNVYFYLSYCYQPDYKYTLYHVLFYT